MITTPIALIVFLPILGVVFQPIARPSEPQ